MKKSKSPVQGKNMKKTKSPAQGKHKKIKVSSTEVVREGSK